MKFKTSEKVDLYYMTYGDKTHEPIVLIHGLGADHKMWKPQIESTQRRMRSIQLCSS